MKVFINGAPFIFKNRKAKEFLAYLLCNQGGPVRNTVIAQILWPDAGRTNAMDSFYKAVRSIKEICVDGYRIPLHMAHGEVCLEQNAFTCDLTEFEWLYENKQDMAYCEAAARLYEGPLFYEECYDWIAPYEAYYDVRFMELAERLHDGLLSQGKKRLAGYYQKRLEEF